MSRIPAILRKERFTLEDLPELISPTMEAHIEELARLSAKITLMRFGRTISMYAPLYISNECINGCVYCAFSASNHIDRTTLDFGEIESEVRALRQRGFGHVLILTGEAPKRVPTEYVAEAVRIAKKYVPHVSIEVYPMDFAGYSLMVESGCDGLTLYQETYHRPTYLEVHPFGPKRDYDFRYRAPIEAAKAGMRGVGLGFLLGLYDWREEVIAMARHATQVLDADWRVRLAFSFPRLRPTEGMEFDPEYPVSDLHLAQMIFALRLVFPDAELVLSTRESPRLRDGFIGLGVTRYSAGSSTCPGGYAVRQCRGAHQFEIDDVRPPEEVAKVIGSKGFEPVWKDWDWTFDGELDYGRNTD